MSALKNIPGFKIIQLNCRSLYRKIDQIATLYNTFDVICCTETWLNDSHTVSMLSIPNMVLFRKDRPLKKGGGVCIYVADKWAKYTRIDHQNTTSTPNVEIISLLIKKPTFRNISLVVFIGLQLQIVHYVWISLNL